MESLAAELRNRLPPHLCIDSDIWYVLVYRRFERHHGRTAHVYFSTHFAIEESEMRSVLREEGLRVLLYNPTELDARKIMIIRGEVDDLLAVLCSLLDRSPLVSDLPRRTPSLVDLCFYHLSTAEVRWLRTMCLGTSCRSSLRTSK